MNIHQELSITSKEGVELIIREIISFGSSNNEWNYDRKRSDQYVNNVNPFVGCVILHEKNKKKVSFSFCSASKNKLNLANIVPENSESLTTTEYNEFLTNFSQKFKKHIKSKKLKIKLDLTKSDLELSDIITAKIPQKAFKNFLSMHPLSYHPNDIERLDRFICAFSRYSRKKLNTYQLAEYLRIKEKWPEKNISWCISRIETGFDIIKVYKKY